MTCELEKWSGRRDSNSGPPAPKSHLHDGRIVPDHSFVELSVTLRRRPRSTQRLSERRVAMGRSMTAIWMVASWRSRVNGAGGIHVRAGKARIQSGWVTCRVSRRLGPCAIAPCTTTRRVSLPDDDAPSSGRGGRPGSARVALVLTGRLGHPPLTRSYAASARSGILTNLAVDGPTV